MQFYLYIYIIPHQLKPGPRSCHRHTSQSLQGHYGAWRLNKKRKISLRCWPSLAWNMKSTALEYARNRGYFFFPHFVSSQIRVEWVAVKKGRQTTLEGIYHHISVSFYFHLICSCFKQISGFPTKQTPRAPAIFRLKSTCGKARSPPVVA